MKKQVSVIMAVFLLMEIAFSTFPFAVASSAKISVIVGFRSGPNATVNADLIQANGGEIKYVYHAIQAIACSLPQSAIDALKQNPAISYVEVDDEVCIDKTPNDPRFSELWGLHNTGQTGGTPDADIDAPEAWNMTTGNSNSVIAVIDTGVDYNHQDLSSNIWTNPGEIPDNGIDDDGNGYIDDIHGWDFYNHDNNPMDDHMHGTHCAGTIAAVGNNGVGIVGVNWAAKIMALKFLSAGGYGYTSDAIAAIQYCTLMKQEKGIAVVAMSNSWGGGGYSQALKDAITAADNAGILFVAAAGNGYSDNDLSPHYPSSYDVPNVIAVAATDGNDTLPSWSNYGATSVDLAAPGVDILSTVPSNNYGLLSGTSMATPHVSGVAALVRAKAPAYTHQQIEYLILSSVDPVTSLSGKMVTGGRLNAGNACARAGLAHDLDVMSIDVAAALQVNVPANVKSTITNLGSSLEQNFEVRLLVNGSLAESKRVAAMNSLANVEMSFIWVPPAEATYKLTVYVPPVSGETLTVNNNRTASISTTAWMTKKVGDGFEPSMATDSDNYLYVAYDEYGSPYGHSIYVKRSTDGGCSWSEFGKWVHQGHLIGNPSITIDPYDNRVYVAYEVEFTSTNYDVFCKVFVPGEGWGESVRITTTTYNVRFPSITSEYQYGSSNYQYISFEGYSSSDDRDLYVYRSSDHGLTWTRVYMRGNPGWPYSDHSVYTQSEITAAEGNIYVVYRAATDYYSTDGDIRVDISSDSGTSWTLKSDVDGTTGDCWNPSIAATHGGDLVMIAFEYRSGTYKVLYSYSQLKGSDPWQKGHMLDPLTSYQGYPVLSVDGKGNTGNSVNGYVHAIYYTGGKLLHKKTLWYQPTTWSPSQTAARVTDIYRSAVTTQYSGYGTEYYPCVAFRRYVSPNYQIQYATVGPLPFNYSLSITPTMVEIETGSWTGFEIKGILTNGTSQSVTLNLYDLPTDIAITQFTVKNVPPSFTSTLVVAVYADAPAGNYNLTVVGEGGGVIRSARFTMRIKEKPKPALHDVAVVDINPSGSLVEQGDLLNVNVTVENQGLNDETFDVTAYANSTDAGDNFDDNLTDSGIWKALEKNNGTVSETNGRVECSVKAGSSAGTAGYITRKSYDLSDCDIQVYVSNQHLVEFNFAISPEGTTDHYWNNNNFYSILKVRYSGTSMVRTRTDGGSRFDLYSANWTGPTGYLRIRISNGTIYFYEENILRYSEPYRLNSYKCYIYLEGHTWSTNFTGMDYFDNFKFTGNKPVDTKQVYLPSGNSTIVGYTWNTTDCFRGNYILSAYAWPVPLEIDTADNSYVDGVVRVISPQPKLTLSLTPSTVPRGQKLIISGQLTPGLKTAIKLYYRKHSTGTWGLATTISTDSNGIYNVTATVPTGMTSGSYDLVAVWFNEPLGYAASSIIVLTIT